jgi:hypothetical protein
MKRFSIGLAAVAALVVLVHNAAAANPIYVVTCPVGGQTSVSWSHAKVTAVTLEWFTAGSANAYATETPPITWHRPRGSILSGAGVVPGYTPASVSVTFQRFHSSEPDVVTVGCS